MFSSLLLGPLAYFLWEALLPVCIRFTSTNAPEQKTTVLAGFCLRRAFLVPPSGQLEKAMATPSSVLAWRIPGMAEPGGLPSNGVA